MKKIIGILVVVNVAVFLWPTKNPAPVHVHPNKVDVNASLLKLNKEVEHDYRTQQRSKAEAALSTIEPDEGVDDGPMTASQCYRLGPFSLQSNFEIAQATLLNAGLDVDSSIRAVNRTEVYRVFLGPFANRATAIDTRSILNNKGVLDHFIRNEPDGSVIVSLGIYTTQVAATVGVDELKTRIDGVEFREEVVTLPESYWLYFSLAGDARLRKDLEIVDWGEVGAQIGPFQCRGNLS